jgi:transcriptional regulator with XRE-family HTH domain
MNGQRSTRRRSTEALREAQRLTQVITLHLGRAIREGRTHRRLTQEELAGRVGVTQAWISRIELGHGRAVPLELWVKLGVALDRPLAVTLSRPLGEPREPTDAGHLAMQERLLGLARATGRSASFELPTRPADPRHSIDVCVRDARNRVLLIEEAWNTFGDLGAAIRSTNRKVAEAADLKSMIDDGAPYRVAAVWVVRPSAANRRLVARYRQIFRSALPGSSKAWVASLTTDAAPPVHPGLVWLDPASGLVTACRLPDRTAAPT